MLISHKKKFIFIHNYKVAGTSVRSALAGYCNKSWRESSHLDKVKIILGKYPSIYSRDFDGHIKALQLSQEIDPQVFISYFKFGFVRNPWDWQVSLYTFMLKTKTHPQHKLASDFENFDDYIDWRVHEDLNLQKDFFYSDNQCLVDFIGRHENLYIDFNRICEKCDLNTKLPYLNASRKPDDHFSNYYSPKSMKMVEQAFSADIELFNYKFETINKKINQINSPLV